MATFAEAIKDKRGFPDSQEVDLGNGTKMTLGELRQYQEATGQDVAKQLEAERTKMQEERAAIAKAQEEVVTLWTKLQEASQKQPAAQPASGTDWRTDPFFAPVAEYLKTNVESSISKQAEQIAQFQKALGLGVKYITDTLSEMRYGQLPEDFRKETPYDAAVRAASEKKFLDSGGVPDVRKVYEEWKTPREREKERNAMREEIRNEERQKAMQASLPRPGGMPANALPPAADAPKNMRESFQKLKEDPQFIEMIYGMGQGQA